jgi:hypothetical protein
MSGWKTQKKGPYLLDNQYANNKPTLSLKGSVVTSMHPKIEMAQKINDVQTRPFTQYEAIIEAAPTTITDGDFKYRKHKRNSKLVLSTTPSTQPISVVLMGVNPN